MTLKEARIGRDYVSVHGDGNPFYLAGKIKNTAHIITMEGEELTLPLTVEVQPVEFYPLELEEDIA